MRFALNAICATILMGCQPLAADYIFALDPVDGKVSGNLGQTIGWGYRLTNLSGTDWLMPTSLDAGLFSHSTPELWFGFPILPPGTEVHVPFDLFNAQGLLAITWDPGAPNGSTEQGEFLLQAEWWSGDPFGNGAYLQGADPTSVAYEARLGSAVPEPATSAMAAIAILLALGRFVAVRLRRVQNDC
jgi:hypothetical protein